MHVTESKSDVFCMCYLHVLVLKFGECCSWIYIRSFLKMNFLNQVWPDFLKSLLCTNVSVSVCVCPQALND